ncbi:hypothetical protein SAMN05660489_00896 [Pseudomonas sp. LAMO17WK12:I10]|nr:MULTISPECIES: hypothetical protein [unclassified Pseudomonas]PXX75018.1 hypothetical protein H160_01298 [Pseudomonas sp. LAMO17WK12:I9]SNY16877.1 hypothetical protein SAMN05660489_00896 [Pseudomonas sp. LAMO17WK12:I10]
MLLRKIGFVSLLSLLSFQALADDRGLYLGAGVSSIETDKTHLSDEDYSYSIELVDGAIVLKPIRDPNPG